MSVHDLVIQDPVLDPRETLVVRHEDGVPVLVLPNGSFEAVRDRLKEDLALHRDAIGGRGVRIDMGDREIVLFDLRRWCGVIKEEAGVDVTGLYLRPGTVNRFAERELKMKLFTVEPVIELPEPPTDEEPVPSPPEPEPIAAVEPVRPEPAPTPKAEDRRRTMTAQKTLRSGMNLRFDGDVLLFGDVNPGAQIIASGNIVVLGAIKGLAHAGAAGDESAYVMAFDLRPTQIRIAQQIAIPTDRMGDRPTAEIAQVIDGRIVIDSYRGRGRQ
jgi:septum site-determining protein MinC